MRSRSGRDLRGIDSRKLAPGLALRVPVVQAPLGRCDGVRLAAAVSRAGGLGCLTVHNPAPAALRRRLRRLRALTRRPVLLAFTAQFESDAVFETCLDEGFRHFQGFWWNGTRVGSFTRRAPDGALFWQVGYPSQAEEAVAAGADVLVAQGTEAGGPVRTSLPVRELIRDLRAAVGDDIPLVAGGGLADGRDVADVLRAGAHAALLGTRFLLTDESDAPARDKGRLLRARSEDLILDPCLRGAWPCDPRRRMATPWGEDAPSLFAGTGVTRISSIRPAAAVLRDLRPRRAV